MYLIQQPCTLLFSVYRLDLGLSIGDFEKNPFCFLFWEGFALLDRVVALRIQGVKAAPALALALTPWIMSAIRADCPGIVRGLSADCPRTAAERPSFFGSRFLPGFPPAKPGAPGSPEARPPQALSGKAPSKPRFYA